MDALEQYQNSLKQQELENALSIAQIFGYVPENYSELLGMSAGTLTADQAYNEWYMAQQAAKAAANSSNTGGTGGNMSLTTAKQAASNGVLTDDVISVLKANGYSDEMLSAIYGYEPAGSTSTSGTKTSGNGSAYTGAVATARIMQQQGATANEIFAYLDSFDQSKLTDAGLDSILKVLNINGYGTGA